MYACMNNMENVALRILATGKSNPRQVNRSCDTALFYACKYKMIHVIEGIIKDCDFTVVELITHLSINCRGSTTFDIIKENKLEYIIEKYYGRFGKIKID